MSYDKYYKKFLVLLEEAEKDFANKCYNKAVSALWFSVESLLKGIVLRINGWIPEEPGKLISLFAKILEKRFPSKAHLMKQIHKLYIHRVRADHRADIYEAEIARKIYFDARRLINELMIIAKNLGINC